jgi:hypothetical protein
MIRTIFFVAVTFPLLAAEAQEERRVWISPADAITRLGAVLGTLLPGETRRPGDGLDDLPCTVVIANRDASLTVRIEDKDGRELKKIAFAAGSGVQHATLPGGADDAKFDAFSDFNVEYGQPFSGSILKVGKQGSTLVVAIADAGSQRACYLSR